jgi:hypothetical protein
VSNPFKCGQGTSCASVCTGAYTCAGGPYAGEGNCLSNCGPAFTTTTTTTAAPCPNPGGSCTATCSAGTWLCASVEDDCVGCSSCNGIICGTPCTSGSVTGTCP